MSQIWPLNLSKKLIFLIQWQWWSATPIFHAFFEQKWMDFLHFDKILGKKYFLLSNLSIAARVYAYSGWLSRLNKRRWRPWQPAWIRIKAQLSDWKYISGFSIPISQIKFVTAYKSRFVTIQESNNNTGCYFRKRICSAYSLLNLFPNLPVPQ